MENPFSDNPLSLLSKDTEITINQILNNLLNSDKNLALKTEIYNPKRLALLLTTAKYLESLGLPKSSKVIMDFIESYLKYMVSYKRKSRIEVIKALSRIDKSENSDNILMNNLD